MDIAILAAIWSSHAPIERSKKKRNHEEAVKEPSPPPPKKKTRRGKDPTIRSTTIKVGLKSLCRSEEMRMMIEDIVRSFSRIMTEASMLTSLHVIRLLEQGKELPKMDQTFFYQAIAAVADVTNPKKQPSQEEWGNTLELYRMHYSKEDEKYVYPERIIGTSRIFNLLADQMVTNFNVSIETTFTKRVAYWFRLQLKLRGEDEKGEYFNKLPGPAKKHLVSLLVRASTRAENEQLKDLLPYPPDGKEETKKSSSKYNLPPREELEWMQQLCDEIQNELYGEDNHPKPLSYNLKAEPHKFLPILHSMLKDLQRHVTKVNEKGCKLYSLLPQKQPRATFIPIDKESLKHLATRLNMIQKKKAGFKQVLPTDPDSLWRMFFNIDKVERGTSNRQKFGHYIRTDGVTVNLLMKITKLTEDEDKPPKQEGEQKEQKYDRIVAIDPGRKAIFTAAVYDLDAHEALDLPHTSPVQRHETIQWSNSRWREESGTRTRSQKIRLWTNKNPVIMEFNKNIPSAKVSDSESYCKRIKFVLTRINQVLDFYCAKRHRKLRWRTYVKEQKAYEKIVRELAGDTPRRKVLIAYGDAGFSHASKGTASGPTKTLRKMIAQRVGKVVDIDEYNTSKLCCACKTEMKGLRTVGSGDRGNYSVRQCANTECNRNVWNRDVNAAINIINLYLYQAQGILRPLEFSRPKLHKVNPPNGN